MTRNSKKTGADILGLDLGNTIVNSAAARVNGLKQTYEHALRVIERLVEERFGQKSYIISRVTPEQKVWAQAWLVASQFHEKTGLPARNVEFCVERHEKAAICKRLGITHFVDDRPEVMSHITTVPYRYLFQANPDDFEKFRHRLDGVIKVDSWLELEALLLPVPCSTD